MKYLLIIMLSVNLFSADFYIYKDKYFVHVDEKANNIFFKSFKKKLKVSKINLTMD